MLILCSRFINVPLTFLLYINDINNQITSTIRLFADDCVMYYAVDSPEDALALQGNINLLDKWANTWQMPFNTSKCTVMLVTEKRSNDIHNYTMLGNILDAVSDHPYLEITITENLSWSNHVTNKTKKANSVLGFVRRNLSSVSEKTK